MYNTQKILILWPFRVNQNIGASINFEMFRLKCYIIGFVKYYRKFLFNFKYWHSYLMMLKFVNIILIQFKTRISVKYFFFFLYNTNYHLTYE